MRVSLFPRIVGLMLLLALAAPSRAGVERMAVDHASITALARQRAEVPYEPPPTAPEFYRQLGYDAYRGITFNPEMSLWRDNDLPFRAQFFHPGYLFTQMVRLNEFTGTHTQSIPFGRNFFNYPDLDPPLFSRWGMDFAGFRVLHPLNRPQQWDEVISFLGASYYRALARNQAYGASARGLAINAGSPTDEEFPVFREFWLGKPEPGAARFTAHALLDGPSVAGAYTFVVTPGVETLVEIRATLFFRRGVAKPGFAPLSSMFWFGEGSAHRFGDFRPEVHDSDGLLIAPDANTRLWRPLMNPPEVWRTEFDAPALAGFGLLQRDRNHASYADLESRFERRPGVWNEPIGEWPPGRVHLVEMPVHDEYHDNVTAYWSPRDPIPPGQPLELAWKQRWSNAPAFGGPPGWVGATRQTVHDGAPHRTLYVIDFDAASLAHVAADAPVSAATTISPGAQVTHLQVVRNEADQSWRLILRLEAAAGSPPVDIRAQLILDHRPLTELWTTRWQP